MSPDREGKQPNAANLLSIVRGALATDSGDPDDPFHRVILLEGGGEGGGKTLAAGSLLTSESDESARDALDSLLEADPSAREADAVALGELGTFRVVREIREETRPLQGKTAIVTGAGGAIGVGLCRGLLAKGCRVAAADLSQEALDSLLAEYATEAEEGRLAGVHMDVTREDSVADAFDEVARTWGGVDIVVV
ncbi:MAG: SDR family NAD(P)-dependent oxidoreductase, partial [Lentisphaerae bacterium]|nr:SDR family NAD(P)-dependent oxidoreductase [Lentisphaerota bacterium]